jgi:hypothetical protein
MHLQCRYPERIKGTVQLCVNGEPFTIGVQAELPAGAVGLPGLPMLELCPRGNNKDVIIIILVHDNVYIPC